MKNVKRFIAVIMALCVALSLAACHKKNETAVKVGSIEFTSGYYACALFFTDSQARSKVNEQFSADGKETDDIDYYKQKIDGKSYVDYVKDETLNTIKKIAAYKLYCEENKLELGEDAQQVKTYAEYYWNNGYSNVLIENGVGKETYVTYMTDLSYQSLYFDHVFGADGEKAVTEEQLKEELSKNYAIADMIDVDYTSLEDEEKTAKTEQLNGYLEELTKGKRTFEEIYHEYNGDGHEESQSQEDEDTAAPLDSHATLIGSSDTSYANDYFDEIYALQTGEVKIIDKADDAGKILVVKKDVMADPYYLTSYESTLRHEIADDDFDKMVEEYIKKLEFKEYKSATDRFKVKKIYYPETTAQ